MLGQANIEPANDPVAPALAPGKGAAPGSGALARLWRATQGAPLAPEQWLDSGWPRLPVLALLVFVPLMMAGPIRCVTHLPLGVSVALGVLATALVLAGMRRAIRSSWRGLDGNTAIAVELVALVPIAVSIWALYMRDYGGFPGSEGTDAGSHVDLKNRFLASEPQAYMGFVSLYAVVGFLEKVLRIGSFRAFAICFHLAVVGYVAAPLAVAFTLARARAAGRWLPLAAGLVAAVACELFMLRSVGWVLLSYNQQAGFYAAFFVLLPLMFLWAADVVVRAEPLRLLALTAGVVQLRFTYGLNLPDVMLATALVVLLGTPAGVSSVVQGALALVLGLAAVIGYRKLVPQFDVFGGMARFNLDHVLASHLVLAGGLILYLYLAAQPRAGGESHAASRLRAFRFPVAFALVNAVAFELLRASAKEYYYLTKYQFASSFLLVGACVVLAWDAATDLFLAPWRQRGPRFWMRMAVAALCLVLVPLPWTKGYSIYRERFTERLQAAGAPYTHFRPVADTGALRRIERTLDARGKKFGGYLTSFFPMFSFMNASLGFHSGKQEFFAPDTSPGHCVFWVRREHDTLRTGPAHVLDGHRAAVAAGFETSCEVYRVRWKDTPQSLCTRCY
jgi:hypothetical protein